MVVSTSISIPSSTITTRERLALYEKFKTRVTTNPMLDRTLVSFQGNRRTPFYSWFKYREGFSEALVTYLLKELMPQPGVLLDPFAGTGTALFTAGTLGWRTKGIELLPVGIYAMQARTVAQRVQAQTLQSTIQELMNVNFADYHSQDLAFNHIPITRGAYPVEEEKQLIGYIAYCHQFITNQDMRTLLLYASFCILEDISYTRKDGQYLRWDARSGRSQGKKPFHKGYIMTFKEAIQKKLEEIASTLTTTRPIQHYLFDGTVPLTKPSNIEPMFYKGSCLEILPAMEPETIDFVLTSPPYANRYDYTRTYALELVYLGCSDEKVKQLRQTMLSCTVENKDKRNHLEQYYKQRTREQDFSQIEAAFQQQAALQEVLTLLKKYREEGLLNNENISRMVCNYFYEMCFVIYELARVLKPGGIVAMVNDNVRYAGEEVTVDLILCDIAETFGLKTRHIWTLGRGKGNSSQQMGNHGRSELRKCVYVWEK